VLLETHQGRTELRRRFVEEAQISGQLQHPGIAPVYALGQLGDGRPYFSMKLVKGQTLAKLLATRTEPGQERPGFLKVFEQVCQTLAYAHSRGVIHRDLKPANVMVGAFGEVQVMDWGLAKVLARPERQDVEPPPQEPTSVIATVRSAGGEAPSGQTHAGSVLGTPAYMAPEQALGAVERLDERADVFGLGAILCEILTGRPPYTGADVHEVHRKAVRADLAGALGRLAACGAEDELIDLTRRCLGAEPADRPRDAGELAEAVGGYLAGVQERLQRAERERAAAEARAAEARATTAAERRARRRTLGLALAALLLAAGGGWLLYQRTTAVRA
jgi:serine/threonine-protein kinase